MYCDLRQRLSLNIPIAMGPGFGCNLWVLLNHHSLKNKHADGNKYAICARGQINYTEKGHLNLVTCSQMFSVIFMDFFSSFEISESIDDDWISELLIVSFFFLCKLFNVHLKGSSVLKVF